MRQSEASRQVELPLLKIDPQFRGMLPKLSPEAREQLRANLIEAGGARDPVVVWDETGIVLDGHGRYELCEELGLPYETVRISLPDRAAALRWVIQNQTGRRNLNAEQLAYIRGQLYRDKKKPVGRPSHESIAKGDVKPGPTAAAIAAAHNVHPSTVERDSKFAEALDALPDSVRNGILSGQVKATRETVIALAAAGERAIAAADASVVSGARELLPPTPANADRQVPEMRELESTYRRWLREIKELQSSMERHTLGRYGGHLAPVLGFIKSHLDAVQEQIAIVFPVGLCPSCSGLGCEACRDTGVVTRRDSRAKA